MATARTALDCMHLGGGNRLLALTDALDTGAGGNLRTTCSNTLALQVRKQPQLTREGTRYKSQ